MMKSASFHLAVSDIHYQEMRKLKQRKYIMHGVMSIIALVMVFLYAFYYTKGCVEADYFLENNDEHWDEYMETVYYPLMRFIWISFLLLGIIFFTTGCLMLNRLRLYFVDFYKEFGWKLWVANIFLTLPLTFRAVFDALKFDDEWSDYWFSSTTKEAGLNLLLIFCGTYVPMLLQISTLIFGFVR